MTSETPVTAMTYVRSVTFYFFSFVIALPFFPLFPLILLPREVTQKVCLTYLTLQGIMLKHLCGIRVQITGLEHMPEGPVLIASQHESTWETLAFQNLLGWPVMYAKEEIFAYPIFGPLTRKLGHIRVSQTGSGDAMREGFKRGTETLAQGRKLLIFPSGTRRVEDAAKLQSGVGVLYQLAEVPVVPVLVNSGACWPYGTWLKHPGTIRVEVRPAILSGMPRAEMMDLLRAELARSPGETP